jgi:GTP 3',8-cyclase
VADSRTCRVLANDRLRLAVTSRCNFRCFYCSNEGQAHGTGTFMAISTLRELAIRLRSEGVFVRKINITGGEPTLHPHLLQIVELCRSVCESVTLNTNGALLTPELLKQLWEGGLTNVKFGVDSFTHGPTKPGRRGSYGVAAEVVEMIRLAQELMPRSSANIVLTAFNMHRVPEVLASIEQLRLNWVEFLELIPMRGLEVQPYLIADALESCLPQLDSVSYNRRLAKFICTTRSGLSVQFAEDFCRARVCRNLWTRIDAEGRVVPCLKAGSVVAVSRSESLTEQLARCNSLMCDGPSGFIPRDQDGRWLGDGLAGRYEPLSLGNVGISPVATDLDP